MLLCFAAIIRKRDFKVCLLLFLFAPVFRVLKTRFFRAVALVFGCYYMYACQDHSGKSSGTLLPRWEIEQATGTVVCVLRLSLAHVVGFVYIATGLGYRLN